MELDIVFAGVGGQGIVVASDILCEAALLDGFNVAKAETHGMAQRGGSIIAHVRIGDNVSCQLIERGTSDIILGFEILEAARALHMLKDKGKVIVNMKYIPPTPVLQGLVESQDINELINLIRRKAFVYEIDGTRLAAEAGDILSINIVLLGALLAALEKPIREESIKRALSNRFKMKYLDVNFKALQLGRESLL